MHIAQSIISFFTHLILSPQEIIGRLGRWIDFKNDYKTLYPSFMESIWWVFKQLYDKGLVYRGCKVMPFSTACGTPLSNFESGQNYKDVQDPAGMEALTLIVPICSSWLSCFL
jgi:isoleucyl-tRNA synthetase